MGGSDLWSSVQDDFFVPLLAFCCEMMNSRISLAVRQGFSITTECPQFSSMSTLHPGSTSAMTEAPETSTTWTNSRQLSRECQRVTQCFVGSDSGTLVATSNYSHMDFYSVCLARYTLPDPVCPISLVKAQ